MQIDQQYQFKMLKSLFHSNILIFWRFLDLTLTNCELELKLSWTKDCVLIEQHKNIRTVKRMITSTKHYVTFVTFSINDNTNFFGKYNARI